MSMTGSGRAVICRNLGVAIPQTSSRPSDAQRPARQPPTPAFLPQLPRSAAAGGVLQAALAGPQRRTSFVGILHQMSAQNRLLSSRQDASKDAVRRLSYSDVERASGVDAASTTTTTDLTKEDANRARRRRTSDGGPRFSVGRDDNVASTSHSANCDRDDVTTSRDRCEYTVNIPNL